MTLNRHGLKIDGIKKAAAETRDAYRGFVWLYYDAENGKVWAEFQASRSSWMVYPLPILRVCGTDERMTMQEIADCVALAVDDARAWDLIR